MMFGFLKRFECRCQPIGDEAPGSDPESQTVPATSPARLLAGSLTDEETRSEWERVPGSMETEYRNARRDILIKRGWFVSPFFCNEIISTPFSLTEPEKAIVKIAMLEFDKRQADEREAAALARLVAQEPGA